MTIKKINFFCIHATHINKKQYLKRFFVFQTFYGSQQWAVIRRSFFLRYTSHSSHLRPDGLFIFGISSQHGTGKSSMAGQFFLISSGQLLISQQGSMVKSFFIADNCRPSSIIILRRHLSHFKSLLE